MSDTLDRSKLRAQNRKNLKIVSEPHPFLKWAGGKRQLLKQLDPFIPSKIKHYIEPFVGGGALFFYLLPENAVLIDNNPVLINVYKVIQKSVDELIEHLKQHKNEKEYFYQIRELDRFSSFANLSPMEKASRTIFLNRTCFNGLYRVNSKGYFNVPFGKYKNPVICDEKNLRTVHEALQGIKIIEASFESVLDYATQESLIYFDPPYMPLSKTSNFTGYTKELFRKEDQIRLKEIINQLNELGCNIMLSNSYCDFILDLFSEYNIHTLSAKRAINSNGKKRGAIPEVLITNF
ncbi:MAG: DNA adenine methylase [Promethearchaeia archaeon]|nr:MAG: DNA adenine methylase [Candidatus Lokiarchaeia archaeon]